MRVHGMSLRRTGGFSLVELMVALTILLSVVGVLSAVLMQTNRTHRKTTKRAEIQASSRQALALMTAEILQAGADPRIPPVGLVGIVSADTNMVRIRADLNADGATQTTEPSEDVTYTFNPVTHVLTRNPGSGAVTALQDVVDLRFTYFDANGAPLTALPLSSTDRALVRSIGVTMTCDDEDSNPYSHSTRITLRNQRI